MNTPISIEIKDEGLKLEFETSGTFIFPFKYLRMQCPCANCVEEMTGRKILNVNSVPENTFIVDYTR